MNTKHPTTPVETPRPRASPSDSRTLRIVLWVFGTVCLALGLLGIVLPLVPTTPLVLLAAACYARSSTRFYSFLASSQMFGPVLREWEESRTIPRRAKRIAIALVVASFSVSVFVLRHDRPAAVLLSIGGIALVVFLARLRTSTKETPNRAP